jgi:hypothetical protein
VVLLALVGPDQAQPREPPQRPPQHQLGAVGFLDIRRMDHDNQQQPQRVDEDVALAAVYLLGGVVAARPPLSVVLTDWLSRIAALGVANRPSATRSSSRKAAWIASQVPSFRQALK